jgi:hypothetical protein
MKHVTYVDAVKKMAASNWGRQFETDEAAQRHLLKDIDLSGACLLGIVSRIDKFLALLAEETVRASLAGLDQRVEAEIKCFVESRVAKHGPCPFTVLRYLRLIMFEEVGRRVLIDKEIPVWIGPPPLPPRGTVERKEYDKWVRRKVTPKVQ